MKHLIDEVLCWVMITGEKVGLEIILLVVFWDNILTGYRGFYEGVLGWKGKAIILACYLLIKLSKRIAK